MAWRQIDQCVSSRKPFVLSWTMLLSCEVVRLAAYAGSACRMRYPKAPIASVGARVTSSFHTASSVGAVRDGARLRTSCDES